MAADTNTLKTNFVPFDDLPTSTTTAMVFSNIKFDHDKIFKTIKVNPTGFVSTLKSKKKNVSNITFNASYGSVGCVQKGVYFRGEKMSKKKKYWCPTCQLYNAKDKQILTIEEEQHELSEEELLEYPSDTKKLKFKCKRCNQYHERKNLGKIVVFLNQLTIVIALESMPVTSMFFDSKCKLSGTKNYKDVTETMMLLWEEYLQPNKYWEFISTHLVDNTPHKNVQFCLDPTMRNVGFKLDFSIDKCSLNQIMNKSEYSDKIYLSQHEATSATHVNIKTYTSAPIGYMYDILTYDNATNTGAYFMRSEDKLYADVNEKVKKSAITFIVFSSANIILSGRYLSHMREMYEFFIKTAEHHRGEIVETINTIMPLKEFREMVGW